MSILRNWRDRQSNRRINYEKVSGSGCVQPPRAGRSPFGIGTKRRSGRGHCSTPVAGRRRGEHVVLQEEIEFKILEQRDGLGNRDIQKVAYRRYALQGVVLAGHNFQTLPPLLGSLL